jgi:hypothetical protein
MGRVIASEAIQLAATKKAGLLRRCALRNDRKTKGCAILRAALSSFVDG